jgi:hypothetical protein
MDNTGIMAVSGLVISILGSVIALINHKRVRSHCCGKDIIASVDVENTTPPAPPPLSSLPSSVQVTV